MLHCVPALLVSVFFMPSLLSYNFCRKFILCLVELNLKEDKAKSSEGLETPIFETCSQWFLTYKVIQPMESGLTSSSSSKEPRHPTSCQLKIHYSYGYTIQEAEVVLLSYHTHGRAWDVK